MSAAPRVSVVVPCYNLGGYLDEAVDSVLGQTFQDFEIVVVNDGSTDPATRELLADYRRPRTRVLTTPHRGLAAARNLAIADARGEYLCALDADDRLVPTYLEKAVRILDGDPTLAFVSCWLRSFGAEEGVWRQDRCDLPALLGECTVLTAALVRRAAVLAVGGYDDRMPEQGYEDWDLWLTLVERGHRGIIIPEVLFEYRRRPGSMSAVCDHGAVRLDLLRYLVAKHRESYARHLLDVLLRKEADVSDVLCANDELERLIETELTPAVARRREEVDRLRRKLEAPARERGLETALRRAEAEVAALRQSMSWQVTAPFRLVYGWLLRLGGRAWG